MKKGLLTLTALLVPLAAIAGPFDGPYVGVHLGQADARDKGVGHDQATGANDGWSQKTTPDGALYGLMGGYNWRLGGNWLVGVEADFEGRSGSDRSFQKEDGVTDTGVAAKTQLKSAASLRGRVGYVFDNRAAVYATAGYATASVKRTWYDIPFGPQTESHTSWQDGWTAGVGVDYLLTGKIAARLEYRHTDYGTKKVSANLWDEFYKQSLTEDSVRVGLSYQF
ncbi:MAG: porin family protein [Rhodocyclales bacterium]|nr:porin family protein [Rhodocyclales bacterium]